MTTSWKKVLALLLVFVMLTAMLAACTPKKGNETSSNASSDASTDTSSDTSGEPKDPNWVNNPAHSLLGHADPKVYTYKDYSVTIPSKWNELDSQDGAERDIYDWLISPFFTFDFKFDENGEIVDGAFVIEYVAATKLEDVTAEYKGKYGITADDRRAWKITLREDLTWDDGTPIKAEDFVYTMQQQLSPNYLIETAANYWSGNFILHNAKNYFYQGQTNWYEAKSPFSDFQNNTEIYDKIIFNLGNSEESENYGGVVCGMRTGMGFPESYTAEMVATYLVQNGINQKADATVEEIMALQGKTYAEILADEALKKTFDTVVATWQTEPDEELDFFVTEYTWPEMSFEEVGMFTTSDYSFVIIYDNPLTPIDEDGNLTYEAAYYFSGLPLVKKDLWERLEDSSSVPYKNTYNSGSVENSASWGPYKLTNFQAGTTYTLGRNEKWFGYSLDLFKGEYQTDAIEVRQIPEWNTAWQVFQQGGLTAIGIDVTIADEYRNSPNAYFTPSSGVSSLYLQCNEAALTKEKGNALLKYKDFRNAFSLAINRDDYCQRLTTSSLPYLGLYNDLIYYDVANGGVYRFTEPAREALLKTYGATKNDDGKWVINGTTYDDAEEALDTITGYNPTLAKELLTKAYNEALAAGDIDEGGSVKLTYGSSEDNENTQRVVKFYNEALQELAKGTPLEGKVSVELYLFNSATWIDDFRKNGMYDIANAYISGGAWNPYYSLQIYVDDAQRLTLGWDTKSTEEKDLITLTIPGDGADCKEVTASLSIYDWFASLNGIGGTYDFSAYPTDSRLIITAAVESAVLESYTTIPIFSIYSASLMTKRCDYITYDYNTFMSYGGIQYMTYDYDDTEWQQYVDEQGGTIDYKVA